jgi:signal peptidase I
LTGTLKRLWRNDTVQTAVTIIVLVLLVLGFWVALRAILNTSNPALVVISSSMDTVQGSPPWSHPFARTLRIGDLIIIQGVNPSSLSANYPNSDIIVYHRPGDGELIVHRIVKETVINGKLYFYTKGDGNPLVTWPSPVPDGNYDPWSPVSQDLVVGKVVMHVPWIGYIALFMQTQWGIPTVVVLILLLVIADLVIPYLRRKRTPPLELNPSANKI